MNNLSGKTILITGANGGFGREFTLQLLNAGARVILSSRNEPALRAFAEAAKKKSSKGTIIDVIGADISSIEGCEELFDKAKAVSPEIDILIHNAGILTYGYFHQTPVSEWHKVLQLNLLSTMHLTSLFLPGMIARKRGQVVFVSSTAGFIPTSYQTAYSVSKFGVRSFAMALSGEVSPLGIDVTVVYPFWSDTDILKSPSFGTRKAGKLPALMVVSPQKIVKAALRGIGRRRLHVYADPFTRALWWLNKFYPIIGAQPMEPLEDVKKVA